MGVEYQYQTAQNAVGSYNCRQNCDIVLLLDRSASMAGETLCSLKEAVKGFIDAVAQGNERITNSRIGIVSFADHACVDTPLVTSARSLHNAVNALCAGGKTNHAEAFARAMQTFEPHARAHKALVLFTDGRTTAGVCADQHARAIREQGVEIYVVGLAGKNDVYEKALHEWASAPTENHVAIAPTHKELKQIFARLATCFIQEMPHEAPYANDMQTLCAEGFRQCCDICMPACGCAQTADAGEINLQTQGRIIQLQVTVRNVCPGKRVALGCILTEVDNAGNEYHRGTKAITIPAHHHPCPQDVCVRGIHFVAPDDAAACGRRNFRARFIAHHIDSDYQLCEGETTLL